MLTLIITTKVIKCLQKNEMLIAFFYGISYTDYIRGRKNMDRGISTGWIVNSNKTDKAEQEVDKYVSGI